MTKTRYAKLALVVMTGYWILGLFVGTRPALPFVPYGILAIVLIVAAIAVVHIGVRIARYKRPAFVVMTLCCLLLGGLWIAEILAHLANGDSYYLRPLLAIPMIGFCWYGAWKWMFVWWDESNPGKN